MNFFDALHTSSSGLAAQRTRMNLISSNLANVNTTRTAEGGPYKRKEAIFETLQDKTAFQDMVAAEAGHRPGQVKVVGIVDDPRPPMLKYDPQHPDADEEGYVSMPNINILEEMVNMMSATRSYEANIAAVNATKSMMQKALEIGK